MKMNKYKVTLHREDITYRTVEVTMEAESALETDDILFPADSFDIVDSMFRGAYDGPLVYEEEAEEVRGFTETVLPPRCSLSNL